MMNDKGLEWKLQASYGELVDYMLEKYGPVKMHKVRRASTHSRYDAATDNIIKEPYMHTVDTYTRTDDGLLSHTVHTDLKPLGIPKNASQMRKMVYCDALEHLLLRIKIVEARLAASTDDELYGLGLTGVLSNCAILNEYIAEYPSDIWRRNVADKFKPQYADYIRVLEHTRNLVENSKLIARCLPKQFALRWDGSVVEIVDQHLYQKFPLEHFCLLV